MARHSGLRVHFNEGGRIAVVRATSSATVTETADRHRAERRCRHRHLCRGRQFGHRQCDRERAGIRRRRRWGKYLRDVAITGNVIRKAFAGIGVSVVPGAGTALVNNNMISETPRGAVVGLDHARAITADLAVDGAERYAQVVIGTKCDAAIAKLSAAVRQSDIHAG